MFSLVQLRGYTHHKTPFILSMEVGLCGNLGKEGKETGAPRTCLCKPACLADLLMISQKASASQCSVSQPQVEEVDCSCHCCCCEVGGGGVGRAISPPETVCLNRTNCRLWAGQGRGTTDALKIAHASDKFRWPTQVTSIFRLYRFFLSEEGLAEAREQKWKKKKPTQKVPQTPPQETAHCKSISAL